MKNIKFVFVSADRKFMFPVEKSQELVSKHPNLSFVYVQDNTSALADVYNGFIESDTTSDYVIFAHADVLCDFEALATDLEQLDGKYDVIGLCGCSQFDVSASPLNWYCGSNKYPNSRWGCVTHGELGGQTSFFNGANPDVKDHEVACIDGLLIALSRKAMTANLRFDPSVGRFSHYDTDISMSAVMLKNLKVGVVVRRELQHYSVGRSILTDEFKKDEGVFRMKWAAVLGIKP